MSNRPSMFLTLPSRRIGKLASARVMRADACQETYRRAASEAWLRFRVGRVR
jgi:hypothetical protein